MDVRIHEESEMCVDKMVEQKAAIKPRSWEISDAGADCRNPWALKRFETEGDARVESVEETRSIGARNKAFLSVRKVPEIDNKSKTGEH
jgi:hypothetical protein